MSITSRPMVQAYWLGYADSAQFGGQGLDLAEIATAMPIDVVTMAFYNLFPSNMLSTCFGMSHSHDWVYTQQGVQALQAAGIKVTASIIGTPNPPVGWNDIADPAVFAQNAKALFVDTLGCDGIDIDNEDPATPDQTFVDVVLALREALGPKGSDKALLSCATYVPDRDLPWLGQVDGAFDWVSTMAYWNDLGGQQALWQQYADVLGGSNVLCGVACDANAGQNTTPETVQGVAQWITEEGPGEVGGMMLWDASSAASTGYYQNIRQNLTIWTPPAG